MDKDEFEALGDALSDMEVEAAQAKEMVSAFAQECRRLQGEMSATQQSVTRTGRSVGKGLRAAFDSLVLEGENGAEAVKSMVQTMSDALLNQALKPVQNTLGTSIAGGVETGISSLIGALGFANGGAFSGGRVRAFASGGVVDGPVTFPMRGCTGLMGEAGPEAIMPLTRGSDGKLGVRSEGGGSSVVHVNMTINTPDAAGFKRSQAQIAAGVQRAIARGQRNQ